MKLFRAKAIHNNKWYYGGYFEHVTREVCPLSDELKPDEIKPIIITDSIEDWNMPKKLQAVDVDPKTVGMCTGLYDIEKNRIFEGDIVQDESGNRWTVAWNDKTASFALSCQSMVSIHYFGEAFEAASCLVVGNIHEK